MHLNIKDPEAHRLAQTISHATGESMTAVVRNALRDRLTKLEQQKKKASVGELLSIAEKAAALVKQPYVDHADFLYDENGIPK